MTSNNCACVSHDAYTCWAVRYNIPSFVGRQAIDQSGGPCECSCHEDEDYDWMDEDE